MTNKTPGSSNGEDKFSAEQRPPGAARTLHRLAALRKAKGVSQHEIAARMKTTVEEVQRQERSESDLWLSAIYDWAAALRVPVTELLSVTEQVSQATVLPSDEVTRLLEIAKAIRQEARRPAVQRLAQTLIDQLVEILPDLKKAGPQAGARRHREGRSGPMRRSLSEGVFLDRDPNS